MNDSEILDRMMLLARDRLKSAPGSLTAFQNELRDSMKGQAVKAMACLLPEVTKLAAGMGNAAAAAEIDKHLLRIVDQWAKRGTVPAPNAEPLRIAKSDGDTFAATSAGAPPPSMRALTCGPWAPCSTNCAPGNPRSMRRLWRPSPPRS